MKLLALTLLAAIFIPRLDAQIVCPADQQEEWTYRGIKGPRFWGLSYEQCNGNNQSPIRINSATAEKDENLAQLELSNYDTAVVAATIENNGHTIEVRPEDEVDRSISVNGDTYNLHQLHFHWGYRNGEGSEHTLDGVQYAMEMHLVHLNADGEIAVVGIFFQEQKGNNTELQAIVDQLSEVRYKNTTAELNSELNLNNLLPSNPTSFYRYKGSLTTPGCAEGVTWSVVPEPMKVGKAQMLEFRKLYTATEETATPGCKMAGNYRPTQRLNGRQVSLSQ